MPYFAETHGGPALHKHKLQRSVLGSENRLGKEEGVGERGGKRSLPPGCKIKKKNLRGSLCTSGFNVASEINYFSLF